MPYNDFIILVVFTIFLFLLNLLLKKFNFLIDRNSKSYPHKNFINKNIDLIPISGGIFIITFIFFFGFEYKYFFLLICMLGLGSDLNIINSPKTRIFFQIIIVCSLLFFANIYIHEIHIKYFDYLIKNYKYLAILFSIFCLLILINGSNFIDGVNNLLSGYLLLVILFILLATNKHNLVFDSESFRLFFFILLIFFLYNFFNKSFMGDGGAYLLGLFIGVNLINFYTANKSVSPYFIMNLLWYPAFENLFSIIRRFFNQNKTSEPDNLHLHHLIFLFLLRKLRININFISSLVGILINLFNLIFFYFLIQNIYSTKFQVFLTFLIVFFYISSYYFFLILNKKYKKIT
jgi:UDP-N-acetylmuramyl pentapeptide phosphotransferase/UDP-N-acetylglucosamine-1-phosphate transferase